MRVRQLETKPSRKRTGLSSIGLGLLLSSAMSLLLPMTAWGQTLDAPPSVVADPSGSFCYEAVFTAGPGGEEVFLATVFSGGNTDVGDSFDEPFCALRLAEGEQYFIVDPDGPACPSGISGSLLDPTVAGSISVSLSSVFGDLVCPGGSGQTFRATTTILPYSPLGVAFEIDIKPGRAENFVNMRKKGVIPVAVLTTDGFDAFTVDTGSVRFGPNQAECSHGRMRVKDVDRDGDLDLLLRFRTQETGIALGDMEACLFGQTFDGVVFQGCDSVSTARPTRVRGR